MVKVRSFSRPDVVHTVWQDRTGWHCDCEYYQFRGFRNNECDHIRKVRHQKMKFAGRSMKAKRAKKLAKLGRELDRYIKKYNKLEKEPYVRDSKKQRIAMGLAGTLKIIKYLEREINETKERNSHANGSTVRGQGRGVHMAAKTDREISRG